MVFSRCFGLPTDIDTVVGLEIRHTARISEYKWDDVLSGRSFRRLLKC